MSDASQYLPLDRFLWTLDIVEREGRHLCYSWQTLFDRKQEPDSDWVSSLEHRPEEAVLLDAFVSRYSRMQDTIADKLIPRWLQSLAEPLGSQIENLNRAERLGVLKSTEAWLEARMLRNLLVHEYMQDAQAFAEALMRVRGSSLMLIETYNLIRRYADQRMALEASLPPRLEMPQRP